MSPEVKLIDHQIQRYRVFKQIGLTYLLKFVSHWMLNKFADLEGDSRGIIVDTKNLIEIAASSAGLKAITTIMVCFFKIFVVFFCVLTIFLKGCKRS